MKMTTYDLQMKIPAPGEWLPMCLDYNTLEELVEAERLLRSSGDYYANAEFRIVKSTLVEKVVSVSYNGHLVEYCTERGCPCEGKEGMCVRCGQETGALSEVCPGPKIVDNAATTQSRKL